MRVVLLLVVLITHLLLFPVSSDVRVPIDRFSSLLEAGFRPPAVPLIVTDPYFSIWSFADNLTDTFPTHWSGKITNLVGLLRIDGRPYRFMSIDTWDSSAVPPMQQEELVVTNLQTFYRFRQDGVELNVTFLGFGALSDDNEQQQGMWNWPTAYILFDVAAVDGGTHQVELFYSNTGEVAINDVGEQIVWSRSAVSVPGLTVLTIGSADQNVLGTTGDYQKINWGYFHVAVEDVPGLQTTMTDWASATEAFTSGRRLPGDDSRYPRRCNDSWPVLALSIDLGSVGSNTVSRKILLAYDEIKSIRYFGNDLVPYWKKDFLTIDALIQSCFSNFAEYLSQITTFDLNLLSAMNAVGGSKYATLNALAYRQVTGSSKLTWNADRKTAWGFMKEISSDGDVSTVDVIYPASPLFLYLSPENLRLILLPLLAYSNNETSVQYNLAWTPHHLGTWPVCDLTPDRQEQMPVEETGNIFMMIARLAQIQKDISYLDPYWPLFKIWGDFLTTSLPDPPKQLCTDDFEGPTAHNVNLAAKGVVGLGAYVILLKLHGDDQDAAKYQSLIDQYVQFWLTNAKENDHFKREYDLTNTWSLKYNLVFQKLLGLSIFPSSVFSTESSFYYSKTNKYGVPLDDRHTFTLLEYMGAIQALSTSPDQSTKWIDTTYQWAHEGPDRVPLSDWYDTVTGGVVGFRARPTVGDLWTKMLLQ